MGSGKACGQLERAYSAPKHSNSRFSKILCWPNKIWLQYSVVICPLAQFVTPDSSPTLSKRICPEHRQLWKRAWGPFWVRQETVAKPEQTFDPRNQSEPLSLELELGTE